MKEYKAEVHFINVGHGDAVLIEIPDPKWRDQKRVLVIDGGSGEEAEYAYKKTGRIRAVDYLRIRQIHHVDVMVCTHIHEDHTCGLLEIAEYFKPDILLQPYDTDLYQHMYELNNVGETESEKKFAAALNAYLKLNQLVEATGGKIIKMKAQKDMGWNHEKNKHVLCSVLGPDEEKLIMVQQWIKELYRNKKIELLSKLDAHMNKTSILLQMKLGGKDFLFAGDTENTGYDSCMKQIHSDVFKVGHHGQKNSLNREILKAIAPKYAVICGSSDRRYESVAPEILKMLKEAGCRLLFTDCPAVSPYTDELIPHNAVWMGVDLNDNIDTEYKMMEKC